ncbi:MAG TPA: FISUMP domain-containing protein [Fibrobacteria bacterium]|nr:FISUMP domain-containing protein [Fibrobacteria bacterium]
MAEHPASDSASFVKKFAELLVANDAIVSKLGFPRNSIFGVDNEAVLNEAMKIMVQSGKRLDSVIPANGEWALGITAQAVHERVKELVANGVIANDTNALFPPPPVRVTTNVSMAAQIQAGGQAVGVTGSFEATSKIVRATVGVYQDTVDVSGGFDITEPDVSGRPQILNLEGKVSIVAKKATLSGTYRLEIVLEDDQGHTVRAVFAFEVLSAVDDEGPQVRIKSPVDGTGFGYEVQSVLVKADATDTSGVDSVKINGNLAESREAEFVYDLALEPGKTTEILVEAWDKLGNKGVASVSVSRKGPPDTSAPRLKLIGPADGTEFPIETATTTLKWLVSDLSGIPDTGVKIAGKVARRDQDTFSVVVDLPAPGEAGSYRIDATNIKGISNYETVSLKRAADKSPPRFVRLAGTTDTTVPYATTSVSLGWNVTDNVSVASVSIDGKEVARTGDTYAAAIALPRIGEFRIGMLAKDGSGNVVTDSVVVRRAYHDSIPPRFVRGAGTKDTSVSYETTSYVLAWTVTDNDQVESVTIGGEAVAGSDGNYARTVNLANGTNTVVMVALDTAGNEVRDEVAIQRATDAGAPVIVRQAGTKDSTVGYTTSAIVLSWKITDDVDVASVTINGQPATGTAGIYSYALESLQVGPTGVKVTAKDAAGKTSTDSLTITRKDDAGAPVITPETGTGDKTVPYLTTTAQLGWKVVDDNGIDQVTINGAVATGTNGVYTLNATGLKIGANEFTLIAKDIAGKQASHKVTITRAWKDTIDPVVVRQTGTGDQTLPNGTTSANLAWTVTDNTVLKSVTIGGKPANAIGSTYSLAVTGLVTGVNTIAIEAIDTTGNKAVDAVKLTVMDIVGTPVISASGGFGTQTVTITSTTAGATIYYTLDGTPATVSSPLKLVPGTSTFQLGASATINAIAVRDGYTNSLAATPKTITISYDLTLASITVGGVTRVLTSSSPVVQEWELEPGTKSVLVSAAPADPNATVQVGNAMNKTTIPFTTSILSDEVVIKVANGAGSSKSYTLKLTVPTSGIYTDPRDGNKYPVVLYGWSWVWNSNLNYKGPIGGPVVGVCNTADCTSSGRDYTWEEAYGSDVPLDGICPAGWNVWDPTVDFGLEYVDPASVPTLDIPGSVYGDGGSSTFWLPYDDGYGGKYKNIFYGSGRTMVHGGSPDEVGKVRCMRN